LPITDAGCNLFSLAVRKEHCARFLAFTSMGQHILAALLTASSFIDSWLGVEKPEKGAKNDLVVSTISPSKWQWMVEKSPFTQVRR